MNNDTFEKAHLLAQQLREIAYSLKKIETLQEGGHNKLIFSSEGHQQTIPITPEERTYILEFLKISNTGKLQRGEKEFAEL